MGNDIVIDDIKTFVHARCEQCGEQRYTYRIHGHGTYVCGFSYAHSPCEGDRYLKCIVAKIIPEPQEP